MELRGVVVVEDACDDERAEPATVPAIQPVANRPIAHHVLDALDAVGAAEVIVATTDRTAPQVRACLASWPAPTGVELRYVSHAGPVDLVSAFGLAAPLVGEAPCVVHAASGLLAEPLAPLTAALDGSPDAIVTVHQTSSPERPLTAAERRLLHLAELDPARTALGIAGVWAFGPSAIRRVAGGEGDVDLAVVAQRVSAAGGNMSVRLVDAWRAFAGEAADLLELNWIVLDRLGAGSPQSVTAGNRVEGRVSVHETASVSDSVLVGPVVIGAGAQISDAYIGPYTAIGAGCRIEGAEIERSIVSADARVSHVGARITDSVVGPGAHLFRDFSVPRALRVRVGADAELGLC